MALVRSSALLVTILAFAVGAKAQFTKLDDLGSQVAKELKPFKPRLVAVVDFRSLDGQTNAQGHYFAWMIADALRERAKKKFTVASHKDFDSDLAKLKIPASALTPGESLRTLAPQIGADILITGNIERRGSSYLLVLAPVRLPDGQTLPTISDSIVVNDFLDSLVTPLPETALKAGAQGVGMPSCLYCPDPSYTDLGRREKINGRSVLMVLVSTEGLAAQIRPVSLLGYGLDEQAYFAIKGWKFKPATKNGTPVPVIVPVEVTFRLY